MNDDAGQAGQGCTGLPWPELVNIKLARGSEATKPLMERGNLLTFRRDGESSPLASSRARLCA